MLPDESGGGEAHDDGSNEEDPGDEGADDGGGGSLAPPTSAFLELLATLEPTPVRDRQALVDAFMSTRAVPYVEGDVASFLYRSATASSVKLAGDHTGWDYAPARLERVVGTDLFHLSYQLPRDARLDYKFIVDGEWVLDPLNPHTCPSGFGDNSELRMPQWRYPETINFDAGIAHGAVNGAQVNAEGAYAPELLRSDILDDEREVYLYTPPGYDPAVAYPLLVVNDGGEYLRIARMPNVLDNLLDQGLIEPVVVAFVSPVERAAEYVGAKVGRYVQLVDTELFPFIEERVSISSDRRDRAVMGTSYGGFISMRLAHSLPDRLGMFASQSGILLYDGGDVLEQLGADAGLKVWLDTGLIGDATEDSRLARDHLEAQQIPHAYLEVNEGHSWGSWRARLDDILVYLFPAG